MFQTKKDLDKHVRSSLSRLRDNEKNLRGYTIAKLYFKIGEYKTAEHWVSLYLSANDNCAAAHKLRGQCFEKLRKPEQQLLAYQRSLELDKKQTDLLIDVCKLLQMDELSGVTAAKARYWYELAESRNIQDDAVLNLKLKYLNDGANRTDTWKNVHDILLKEIVQRPHDIGLRIRLVRSYIEQKRIGDAFKYVYDIEMKQNLHFRSSIDWYATVARVLAEYRTENEPHLNKDWSYWLLLICTLDRHLFLSFVQSSNDSTNNTRNLTECMNLLFEFDQALNKVVSNVAPNEPDRELATEFNCHFRGQFCLHAATLLFKRELVATARNNWRETTKSALPLLLLAYNFGRVDKTQSWLKNSTENARELIALWSTESRFRCSQAGRTLLSCINRQPENMAMNSLRRMISERLPTWSSCDDVLNEIRRSTTDSEWRKNLYRQLFTGIEQQPSHFMKSKAFERPEYIWPQINDLQADEELAQVIEPSSLARLVYLTLGYDTTASQKSASSNISPDVRCRVFGDLNFSIPNLVNCSAETLNQLDIDTFLYAAAIQAKRTIDVEQLYSMGSDASGSKPRVLPYANMVHRLCTDEQANWWIAAYKVYNNIAGDELAELRATLQDGIEAVRGFGDPRMDSIILLKLGQLFYLRAQDTTKTVERGFLEARTEALFKSSLSMLRMQSDSRSNANIPFRRLFKYAMANNQYEIDTEINALAEEAIIFLADRYFKKKEYEECIEDLAGIRLPFATYFQAESYRKLAEPANTPKKSKRVYLDRARECLMQTSDLLEAPNVDKNHPLKVIVTDDIKRLSIESRKIETNQSMSDSFVSANGRSDLDDSVVRVQREINSTLATPVIVTANNEKLERMIVEMMESLTLLKDDVADIRSKVNNIEEQMSKQQESKSLDPLEEYYDEDRQDDTFLSNASMYPMYTNRLSALQQQHQQQQRNAAALMFSAGYQSLGLNQTAGLNPYQAAALANAATMTRNAALPTPMQMPVQSVPICPDLFRSVPMQSPASVAPVSLFAPPTQTTTNVQQSVPINADLFRSVPLCSVPIGSNQPPVAQVTAPGSVPSTPPTNAPAAISTPKQWNVTFNNAPVEKGPPANVVIFSSDPLPAQNTSNNQLSFSVTIPPQHIKNNQNTALSASKANPSITTALQQPDKKTPVKADVSEKDVKTPTAAEQKSIFGQSIPSTTPFATPTANQSSFFSGFGSAKTQETPTKAAEPAKKNVFEGFSFGLSTASKAGSVAAEPAKPTFSFNSVGQTPPAKPVEEINSNVAANVSASHNENEEYEPTAHFEPVIALPDLIEVKTGEEEEIILFEHRAKLLRLVKKSKEWKDRGIGKMKVLVSRNDPNKVRLLMRREQVLKLCCNQMISKDTKFVKLPNSETALSWCGQDYSENELQSVTLAVRFKTAEVCQRFHQAIFDAQKNMSDNVDQAADVTTKISSKDASGQQKGFGDQFKLKAGSWICEGCYCNNNATDTTCPACNTPKDKNAVNEKPKTDKPVAPKFSFGTLATAVTKTAEITKEKGFGDQFKPKTGSWTCEGCYCSNKATDTKCPACNTPKDKNAVTEQPKLAAPVTSKFSFGTLNATATKSAENTTVSGFGDQFKPKPGSWSCIKCYTSNDFDVEHCVACEAPKDDTVSKKETKNIFGTSSGNFSFGNLNKMTAPTTNAAPTSTATAPTTKFNFELISAVAPSSLPPTIGSETFSFVLQPKSPSKGKSPLKQHTNSTGVEDVSDDENVEEEENQTYFTPVIPLPNKIDVKTGEEDEQVLYSHRAKLFRYRDSEWRERGLGDVKILQHQSTGRLRVVMRRDQILKICLNHALTHEIEYMPKDNKSWHFVTNDYSEGAVEFDQFCLRFKNEETAQEFKRAVDDALSGVTSKQNGVGNSLEATTATAPRESLATKLTAEESKKITDLKLPADFFDYKINSKCSGCRGCNSDEFVFPEVKDINMITVDENPIPLSPPHYVPSNNLSKDTTTSSSSVTNSTFSFNSFTNTSASKSEPKAEPTSDTTLSSTGTNAAQFGKFNFNTSSNEPTVVKAPTFSFNTSINIFGSPLTSDAPKTTANFSFGSSPMFGAPAISTTNATSTTPTPSIFGGITSFASAPVESTTTITSSTVASEPLFDSNAFDKTATSSPISNIFGGFSAAIPAGLTIESNEEQKKDASSFTFKISNENGMNASSPLTSVTFNATSTPATLDTSSEENNKSTTSIFGTSTGLSFASLAQKSVTATDTSASASAEAAPNLSNSAVSQFSFATLAAQANHSGNLSEKTTTPVLFNTSGSNTFIGLSTRDDFSNFSGPRNGKPTASIGHNNSNDNGNENAADDANYDPHYEPIIELPDEIEISTGEENEEKLFGERAKLYRHDQVNKEWKERGVGEFKILHHPGNNSYRLLLRREQIHKCVLNMALSSDAQINPMKQSDKTFCWVATNFAEDTENGVLETLSVRFKNAQLAAKFYEIVQDCLAQLKGRKKLEAEDD